MLISCQYCGRIHERGFDCGKKPARKYRRKEAEQFRYTSKMKKKSEQIKEDAKYLCEFCLSEGRLTTSNLETHHIEKLVSRPDLALDEDNLICLCRRCHEMAERGDITRAQLKEIAHRRNNPPGY